MVLMPAGEDSLCFDLTNNKKVFFASDFHLGIPDVKKSREREDKIVRWLNEIEDQAAAIFLVGDLFDFWFEYNYVIPRGFIRFQGKMAALADKGIPLVLFTGNHDMWMFDYFTKEMGVKIFRKPVSFTINGKRFCVGHGDGLGPGDVVFKAQKLFFDSILCQWLFAHIPPGIGMWIAHTWSKSSRLGKGISDAPFEAKEKEWLWQYASQVDSVMPHDYYIFGHRHLVLDLPVGENGRYLNAGEWVHDASYIEFDGQQAHIWRWEK